MITALSLQTGGLGRAGNQFFLIASTIGIAIKSGQTYGFPKWINRDNALFGEKEDDMSEHFANPLPPHIPEINYQDYGYFWEYKNIHLPDGNWNMNAHLQSVKWFDHCIDTIRHYFRMKDEPEQNEYVAVHFRAGDYIADPAAYHPRCSMDYYQRAMRIFPEGTKFMIFTDDHRAASNAIPDYEKHLYSLAGNYLTDFALMKNCKSFICANSSYSHFAALLGEHPEKKIIMPRRWFGAAADGLNFDSLYPPEAIIL